MLIYYLSVYFEFEILYFLKICPKFCGSEGVQKEIFWKTIELECFLWLLSTKYQLGSKKFKNCGHATVYGKLLKPLSELSRNYFLRMIFHYRNLCGIELNFFLPWKSLTVQCWFSQTKKIRSKMLSDGSGNFCWAQNCWPLFFQKHTFLAGKIFF